MHQYIARRIVSMIPVVFIVSVAVFSLVHMLPGDPAVLMIGEQTAQSSPEQLAQIRKEMGLDRPIYEQYVLWLGKALRGDLGRSHFTWQPVSEALVQRFPVTLELAILSMIVSLLIAVPAGIISAVRRNSGWDILATVGALSGISMPSFLVGIMLVYMLAVILHWLPPTGYKPFLDDPLLNLKLMIMPAITMGSHLAAVVMRMTRSGLLEVLGLDYVRTARAKGLRERAVVWRHAMKNALIPVVTVVGLQVGTVLAGSVIVETIFVLPGMGKYLVDGIFARDYAVVQGTVLVMALGFLFTNLFVDILYGYVDPRIRYN